MTLEDLRLKVKKPMKSLVICLLSGSILSIRYYSNKSTELYLITNALIYKLYIQNLIRRYTDIHIVVQYSNVTTILQILKFLSEINTIQHVSPKPITILYDASEIENLLLSPDFLLTQQIIRYLSMKHEAVIMELSNIDEVINIEHINDFSNLANLVPKPIRESTPEQFKSLKVNLYIPSSWDSWNKVIMQGKSFILPDTDQVIREESKLLLLDSNYDKFLHGHYDVDDVLQKLNPGKSEVTQIDTSYVISLNDILREIVRPSVVE